MPYPNSNILNIIIPQTSASIDPTSTQAPFVERIISGSRLVLQTDTTGTLIGSSDLNVNSITASNISASGYITASNVYVDNTITADTGSFVYLNLNNTGSAPTNYTSSGMPGEVRFDNNFIYIYTNDVWVRTPIVRWIT